MKKFTKEKKLVIFLLLIITILTGTDIYSLYELNSENNQIIELKSKNSKLQKEKSNLKSKNNEYLSRIKELTNNRIGLEIKLNEKDKQLSNLKDKQSTIDDLNKLLDEKDDTISDLKKQIESYKSYEDAYYDSDYYNNDYSEENNTYTVYITENGSKYHKDGCRYLWNNKIAIDINDAIAEGYEPCSVCNP